MAILVTILVIALLAVFLWKKVKGEVNAGIPTPEQKPTVDPAEGEKVVEEDIVDAGKFVEPAPSEKAPEKPKKAATPRAPRKSRKKAAE